MPGLVNFFCSFDTAIGLLHPIPGNESVCVGGLTAGIMVMVPLIVQSTINTSIVVNKADRNHLVKTSKIQRSQKLAMNHLKNAAPGSWLKCSKLFHVTLSRATLKFYVQFP